MKKLLIPVILALSGCSSVEIASGYIVNQYCKTPHHSRLAVRAFINAGAAPHNVKIVCEGDEAFFTQ